MSRSATDPRTIRAVLAHLAAEGGDAAVRDGVIVECLACAYLRWADLGRLEVTARVQGALLVLPPSKTVPGARGVVFDPTALTAVTALIAARHAVTGRAPSTLFAPDGPLRVPTQQAFRRRMAGVAAAAGIHDVPTPHSIRSGAITALAQQGMTVAALSRTTRHRSLRRGWDANGWS